MPFKLNPFTANLDKVKDLSGYVPYTGATADLDLGENDFRVTGDEIAIGTESTVSGEGNSVFGFNSHVSTGIASSTHGSSLTVTGQNSQCYGNYGTVSGDNSVLISFGVGQKTLIKDDTFKIDGGGDVEIVPRTHFSNTVYIHEIELYSASDNFFISNPTQDKDISILVNDGGVTKYPFFIDSSTASIGIWNTNPSAVCGLDIAESVNLRDKLTVNGELQTNVLAKVNTLQIVNVSTATADDGVLVLDREDVKKRTVDTRVWGSSLVDGSGSAGHIPFWTDANSISYDNGQLYWDSTNHRLGIGTTSPGKELHIVSTAPSVRLEDSDGTTFQFASNEDVFKVRDVTNGVNVFEVAASTGNIVATGNIKTGGTFVSSDDSAGITQTETGVTDFDITIKDGLIVSFTVN